MVRLEQFPGRQGLTVTIDGKKYELEFLGRPNALQMLGDYKARLVKDQHLGLVEGLALNCLFAAECRMTITRKRQTTPKIQNAPR